MWGKSIFKMPKWFRNTRLWFSLFPPNILPFVFLTFSQPLPYMQIDHRELRKNKIKLWSKIYWNINQWGKEKRKSNSSPEKGWNILLICCSMASAGHSISTGHMYICIYDLWVQNPTQTSRFRKPHRFQSQPTVWVMRTSDFSHHGTSSAGLKMPESWKAFSD